MTRTAPYVMPDDERRNKLAFIARMTREELAGWQWARQFDRREPFEGERAALVKRAQQLGVEI